MLLALATTAGVILTVFVALSAVMRYVVGSPFAFTEELVGLLFSVLVFLSLPYVTLQRKHIEVTIVTDHYRARLRRFTDIAAHLLVVLFFIWFGKYAFDFALFSFELNSRTDLSGISLWPWMSAMVVASVLSGIGAAVHIFRRRRVMNTEETEASGSTII
jgi:TRAP-type C4-dicarboxylate transport system permease small subunit